MNSKEFLAERKRLQGQKALADKHGDTKLSESLVRRIAALKLDKPEETNETVKGFQSVVESRTQALNEDVDRITKFLKRVMMDLGVRPSTKEAATAATDRLDHVVPFAAKGLPIWLWTGEQMTGVLTFSRDAATSAVKAIFDDESDKHLIRSFKLAKDDFFEEVDEQRNLKQVKFNATFGSARHFKKAADFTAALERNFGASAFQTHEDGMRSFVLDETGIKRLEAFLAREGIKLEGEAVEAPAVPEVPATDPDTVAPEVETEEEDTYEVEDGFTLTDFMVEPELDRIAKINGGDTEVTFFRLSKTNQISFRVGEFDGRGDKRPQDMHAKVTATKGNNSAAAKKIAKHFSKISFNKGDVDEAFDADYNMNLDLDGINEASREAFEAKYGEFANKLADVWMNKFKNGKVFISPAALGDDSFFLTMLMIGEKSDQSSSIWDNDPVFHRLMVEETSEGQFVVEKVQGHLWVKPPADSHLAMGRVKIPFRKFKGDAKKIEASLGKFVAKVHKAVKDNESEIYGRERIADKYFENGDMVASLREDGMTQKEAIALAKKAIGAPADQKEALMKILNNVGYSVKKVDGKNKLVKGKKEVTLEALAEARDVLSSGRPNNAAHAHQNLIQAHKEKNKDAIKTALNDLAAMVGDKKAGMLNKIIINQIAESLEPEAYTEDADNLVPFLKELYKGNMFVQLDEHAEGSHLGAAEQMKKRADKGDFTVDFVDDQNVLIGSTVFSDELFPGPMTKEKHPKAKVVEKLLGKHF